MNRKNSENFIYLPLKSMLFGGQQKEKQNEVKKKNHSNVHAFRISSLWKSKYGRRKKNAKR